MATPVRSLVQPGGPQRAIAGLGGLFVVAIVAQAGYEIAAGHGAAVRAVERELDTQARVTAEQAARSVQAVDVALRQLAGQLPPSAFDARPSAALREQLGQQASGLVQIDGIAVYDAAGVLRASSVTPVERWGRVDVSALRPFRRLRDEPDAGLMIDASIPSPGTGGWIVPMGRRVDGADGRFLGFVGAGGRVDYFESFYRAAYPDPATRVVLLHRAGWLLAQHPSAPAALGRALAGLDGWLPTDADGSSLLRRMPDPVDGSDRFVAARPVPGYPLAVAVSRDAAAALAPWRAQALATAGRTAGLGLLALGLLAVVRRQLRRLGQARESLAVSEARYALAMTGSDEGHWLWTIPERQVFVSERLARLFGFDGGAQVLRDDDYFARLPLHPDDRDRVHRARLDHVAGRSERLDHEFRIVEPADGAVRWLHTRAQCFRGDDGRPLRMAGSTVDISERKAAEAEREQLAARLRQAQKLEAIGTLAGGIAHDFNNILSAILGYGELAQRDAAPGSAQRRHLDAAMAAAQRAKSLVERILAFSRGGVGERGTVHVQAALDEALVVVRASLPAAVRLDARLDCEGSGLHGDATQLHQVLLNLCTNAVQAMPGGGVLTVGAAAATLSAPRSLATGTLAPGAVVRLEVADTGSGIAPGLVERIFDPFFTTKPAGLGTGLGLTLVHRIVSELGGGIDVRSTPGEGTSFTVWLPAVPWVAPPAADDVEPPPGQGEVVLLVDDEPALVSLGEELLAARGYEAVGFVSGADALAAFREAPDRFDAVLSDEAMPGLSGSELAAAVLALRPRLPVVLASGFVTPALLARAQALGVRDVLAKPLAGRELARCLARVLAPAAEAVPEAPR